MFQKDRILGGLAAGNDQQQKEGIPQSLAAPMTTITMMMRILLELSIFFLFFCPTSFFLLFLSRAVGLKCIVLFFIRASGSDLSLS